MYELRPLLHLPKSLKGLISHLNPVAKTVSVFGYFYTVHLK